MLRGIYSLTILIYLALIRVASLFSSKAKCWIQGRKDLWKELEAIPPNSKVIWTHCASLGEFEQARPIIEGLRHDFPEHYLLLTFFSPSGYEVRKNYQGVDKVCYLPVDLPRNANRFIQLVNPQAAIYVKYEFWFNLINSAYRKGVTQLLISGIFRPGQHFFKSTGAWQRSHLRMFNHIFVQDSASEFLLKGIGIQQVTVSGDTRFDRVIALPGTQVPEHLRTPFSADDFVLVAGSTYFEDETLLVTLLQELPEIKLIIAPHEVSASRIESIQQRFSKWGPCIKASVFTEQSCRVLIIDSIGVLSTLYRLGDAAYIGGGFGKGIHNTLEAAAYGIPVSFGPNWHKFQEAGLLIDAGAATEISTSAGLNAWVRSLIQNPSDKIRRGEAAKKLVYSQAGASELILSELSKTLKD